MSEKSYSTISPLDGDSTLNLVSKHFTTVAVMKRLTMKGLHAIAHTAATNSGMSARFLHQIISIVTFKVCF